MVTQKADVFKVDIQDMVLMSLDELCNIRKWAKEFTEKVQKEIDFRESESHQEDEEAM